MLNKQETNESGKMMALTLALTNFLLLAVVIGIFWLAQFIISEGDKLSQLARGFRML